MGRLIEGLWNCKYCGTKAIKGRHRECPNCGKVRDANTDFYLPKHKEYVSDEQAKSINRNPDWVCEYCGEQLNSDNDSVCKSCGASREDNKSNYFEYRERKKARIHQRNVDKTDNYSILKEENTRNYSKIESTSSHKEHSTKFFNWKVLLSIILCLATIIGLFFLFVPKEKEVTILELSWERTISIEKYKTFDESGWLLPSGARLKYYQQEFHHYDTVLDHYETKIRQVQKQKIVGYEEYVVGTRDLGNGYFEEITATRPIYETYYENEEYKEPVYKDIPIYQTKYYYEIDRWVHERYVKTQGTTKEPYWGELNLQNNEREGRKNEIYVAKVIDKDDKEFTMYFDYLVWKELKVNQSIKVKVDLFGNATLIQ